MDAKFGQPLFLSKIQRPHYGPRGQTLVRSNAMRTASSFAKNLAASTIQRAFRKARVRSGQRTRTGTQTALGKRTRIGFEQQEGANSLTKCNFGSRAPCIPRSVLANLQGENYIANFAENALTTTGLQDYKEISFLDPGTITALSGFQIYKDLFIESVKSEVNMVNASSTNSTVIIYDIICKNDCSVAGKNSSPGVAWSYGVDSAGGSATDYKTVGSIPTESYMFNKFYKVVQRTRVSMAPGQMHRHEVYFKPNMKVQGFWPDAAPYGLQGLTVWTLIVHHGMPAHDSTTNTSVTIDISSLDIVRKYSIQYKFLENSTTNWQKSNTLATTFAVGEQFVNEAVAQVQDAGGLHPGTLHA